MTRREKKRESKMWISTQRSFSAVSMNMETASEASLRQCLATLASTIRNTMRSREWVTEYSMDLKHLTESRAISCLLKLKYQKSVSYMSPCKLAVIHLVIWAGMFHWSVRNIDRATNQIFTSPYTLCAVKHLSCFSEVNSSAADQKQMAH